MDWRMQELKGLGQNLKEFVGGGLVNVALVVWQVGFVVDLAMALVDKWAVGKEKGCPLSERGRFGGVE